MNIAQPLKPKGSLSLIPKSQAVQTGAHIVNDVDAIKKISIVEIFLSRAAPWNLW